MSVSLARWWATEHPKRLAWGVLVFGVGLLSAFRGLATYVRRWGEPNIYLNYSHGLVRRGLVGEVIRLLGLPESKRVFAIVCWLAGLATLALLSWLAVRARHLHPATVLLLLASQFLPTLAWNTGYLDPVICLLVVLTYLCLARGWTIPAAVAAILAPFVHEQFVFFLLPLAAVLVVRLFKREKSLPHLITFAAGVLGTLVVMLVASRQAGADLISASPMSDYVKNGMIRDQLGQTLASSLQYMAGFYATTWRFSAVMMLFMILPALVMLVFNFRLLRAAPWLVTAVIGPLGLLAVAWDLSRFAVMTVFLTFVMLALADSPMFTSTPPPKAEASPMSVAVGSLLALAYAMFPVIYSYPHYAYTVDTLEKWIDRFTDRPKAWPYRP